MLITRRWVHESGDHKHRYLSGRDLVLPVQGDLLDGWRDALARKTVAFITFNPRFTDTKADDALMRRCIAFSANWGYRRLLMTHLFSRVTSDLAELRRADVKDIANNDEWILDAARQSNLVICAWGVHGAFRGRAEAVLRLIERTGTPIACIGETTKHHPRHPLSAALETKPTPWHGHTKRRRTSDTSTDGNAMAACDSAALSTRCAESAMEGCR